MTRFEPSAAQVAAFHQDGFFVVPGLFDSREISLLSQISRADHQAAAAASRADGEGGPSGCTSRTSCTTTSTRPWSAAGASSERCNNCWVRKSITGITS